LIFRGRTKIILEDEQMAIGWAIPAPDGKHLAFLEGPRETSNVWMLEGFLVADCAVFD